VFSDFDIEDLRQKMPIQTGNAAEAIAGVCRRLMTGVERAAVQAAAGDGRDDRTRLADLRQASAHELAQ
jgi:hypothetical protein